MAHLRLVCVLAFVAAAWAASLPSAVQQSAEKLGESLPKTLQQQWTAKLAQQQKNLSSAQQSLVKTVPASVKGVPAALAALTVVEKAIVANLTAFVQEQQKDAAQIVKNYTTLINQRKSSPSTEEAPIHKIRQQSQAIVDGWAKNLSSIHEFAHEAFETAVLTAATNASKKASDPQAGDQLRVAVTNVGVQLLNVLVQEQNDDTNLLTHKQFNLFNDYLQAAETELIKLLVQAKNAKPSGTSASRAS